MKFTKLSIATLVLAALAGVLLWSNRHKPDETKASADPPPAILKLDQSTITRLEFKNKNAPPVVIARSNSGVWQITEPQAFSADQSVVSNILSSLSSLNSERVVDDKPSDLKQFGLDPPAAEVDITGKDNKSQKLLIGDQTPGGGGIYAMLAGDPRLFAMASYEKNSVDKNLNDLRDKRLLPFDPDKISRIDLIHKNQEIEFSRNKDSWQILKPNPLRADDVQVGDLARKLADARMDLSAPENDLKSSSSAFARATPLATAKVTDPSGTQELQLRKTKEKDKETYYAKSSAVAGVYKVDPALAASLDKDLDDFRNKKIFDFGFQDPGKIEMHSGSRSYYLTKGGQDWWDGDGKKLDADTAQSFISQLRDLAATKFPASGFSGPSIEIVVASDGGKRMEKVSIAKSGADYLARRENDSALYGLDPSSVDALQKSADSLNPAK